LLKILKTKNHKSFYPGFSLKFVISDGKDVSAFYNMDSIIKIDRRGSEDKIMVSDSGKENIHQVFTDASFLEKSGNSGIAAIIKFPDEKYQLHAVPGEALGNCEAELEAVNAGLEILKPVNEIRIVSDSRYVRKGLTEWMFNWRLNNWKTSNGKTAKNVDIWKNIDRLTQNKYIEVVWVKGHSGHFENTMCDLYAREAAENS
jgi:ribonuclease HI